MGFSTDIVLPASVAPVWPDACVRCGVPRPGDHIDLSVSKDHPLLPFPLATGRVERAPVCNHCAGPLRFERPARFWLCAAGLTAGLMLGYWLASGGAVSFRRATKWMPIVCGLGGALPGVIYNIFFPIAIEAELKGDTVCYEFARADIAAEFKRLNTGPNDNTPTT
ncbi:MAG: hypothetical protein KF859_08035 [Phycisphaeraceae bacterium]|nr:hypothetical protein [Phycisphaeraceae bacterium]